LNIRVSS